ncbi:MAG: glutamate--cysteine ligase [Hyphomicrobiales bacterium]|nr:glutamate--cysteine ligase [Hyphomicrobiales bacterium]
MARDVTDTTPVESCRDLVEWMAEGCKPPSAWRVGTEHEKIPFRVGSLAPVPYEGPGGIEAILRGMQGLLGWSPIEDGGRIIGLADVTGGGAISLEPGGQFELSGAPLADVHGTRAETLAHLAQVRELAAPMGVDFLSLGMSPLWAREATPVMPKRRYDIMRGYMPKVGTRGLDMMFRTATVQANLDFASEADMVRKLRVSVALQPVATALFANSPFADGRPNGMLSMRSEIWRHVDAARTGMMPWAFEDGMGFERYVDFALDAPMYFVKRGETYHDVSGASFRDLLAGRLAALPGERATTADWANHLSTLFPEVRLKRYLEMRGADCGDLDMICALPALFVGLLYDSAALDEAAALVEGWTAAGRAALRDDVPRLALDARISGRSVREVARDAIAIAARGLARRARTDAAGRDERVHLAPLDEIAAAGETRAQRWLKRYDGAWGRDVRGAFVDCVY